MVSADNTTKHQEMAAVKVGNHAHAVDDVDWFVSQIDCLCQWQFIYDIPLILNLFHALVVSQIGHPE
jgi:hypothetical protein